MIEGRWSKMFSDTGKIASLTGNHAREETHEEASGEEGL